MSYMKHDAIIAISWSKDNVEQALREAERIGLPCSPVVSSPVNGYYSFFIAPDGSKEGWKESDDYEDRRNEWKAALVEGSIYLNVVHVRFDGDYTEIVPFDMGDDE